MESLDDWKLKENEAHLYHVGINNAINEAKKQKYINNWSVVTMNKNDFAVFCRNAHELGLANKNDKYKSIFDDPDNENRIALVHAPEEKAKGNNEDDLQKLEDARSEYEELFGKKPAGAMKLETILNKIEEEKAKEQ